MGVNKVVYNGNTLIDVSQTNVAADKLLKGYSAIGPNGELIEGTFDVDEILEAISSVSDKIDGISGGGASGLIGSDEGVCGIRYKNGSYQIYNQTTEEWDVSGGDIPIKPLSSITLDEFSSYMQLHHAGLIDLYKWWSVGDFFTFDLPSFTYTGLTYSGSGSYNTDAASYKAILVSNEPSVLLKSSTSYSDSGYTTNDGIYHGRSNLLFWVIPVDNTNTFTPDMYYGFTSGGNLWCGKKHLSALYELLPQQIKKNLKPFVQIAYLENSDGYKAATPLMCNTIARPTLYTMGFKTDSQMISTYKQTIVTATGSSGNYTYTAKPGGCLYESSDEKYAVINISYSTTGTSSVQATAIASVKNYCDQSKIDEWSYSIPYFKTPANRNIGSYVMLADSTATLADGYYARYGYYSGTSSPSSKSMKNSSQTFIDTFLMAF